MKAPLLIPLLVAITSPAAAQHAGHGAHQDHGATSTLADTDAASDHEPDRDAHAGHAPPAASTAMDPHADHEVSAAASNAGDPHAAHRSGAVDGAIQPPLAPAPSQAFSGPAHAADLVYGAEAMTEARSDLISMHGDLKGSKFLLERLETKLGSGRDAYAWDAQFWHGGDIDKIWLKSDGEGEFGRRLDSVELQALWSRAIDPWFDLQLGLRQDLRPGEDRTHLAVGTQGLAPYWFEVEAALFLSDKGELTARLEGEYDLRITQRLILQPRGEIELSAQEVPELGIGAGISTAEVGVRLRFEIVPEFAPYIGMEYDRSFGATRDFRRQRGEDRRGWALLVGVRTWF